MTKLHGVTVRQIMQHEVSLEISNMAIATSYQIDSDGICLCKKLAQRSGTLFCD